MHFSEQDKSRLVGFYDNLIKTYGTDDARGEGWSNKPNKQIRFEILAGIEALDGCSLLDVGCGFGDFLAFLQTKITDFTYLGIDINPEMIKIAEEKYPTGNFIAADFGEFTGQNFDYIFSSGALSFKITDYKKIYFDYIKKMFSLANKGVAFNMLNAIFHIDNETYAAYSIKEVADYCATVTDKIVVRQDYLDQDFTVYLYR